MTDMVLMAVMPGVLITALMADVIIAIDLMWRWVMLMGQR